MVSYSTGAINSLLDKLTKVKKHPDKILDLRRALVALESDFFGKLARRREMNSQVEAWVKHVSELVFDMEDWIEQKGHEQLEIEEEMENFQAQIKHARELCERYNLVTEVRTDFHGPAVVPGQVTKTDSRPLVEDKSGIIVDVPNPRDGLLKLLRSEHEKRLKTVFIVGMEGLGKTTLAKEIYEELQGEFDCRAFVTLGRRPSMRGTLMDILRQVKSSQKKNKVKPKTNPRYGGEKSDQDLENLVSKLWDYLGTKRYFILVDGVWSTQAWGIINCALPNKNHGSRVLTTTCISDVGKFCSVRPTDVYWMETLSDKKSEVVYEQETKRVKEWPAEVATNMLNMCGGMPLAIIIAAGILSTKDEELPELNMSVVSSLEQYSTSKGMAKILQISYAALSMPLKSCLLYLSIFREDYTIKKDRLIHLWIAEGLIPIKDKEIKCQEIRDEETRCEEVIVDGGEKTREKRGEEKRREETSGEEKGGEDTVEGGKGAGVKEKRGEEIICEEKSSEEKGAEETSGGKIRCEEAISEEKDGKGDEESLWETGEKYFNELITRRLIQPVFGYDDDQAVGCTVHSVILDFIKSLSCNGNFVTFGADLKSGLFPGSKHTVRRFSLDCYDDQDEDGTLASIAVHLSRVRSVTVLGDIQGIAGFSALTVSGEIQGTSVLPSFKLIRVLDLEDTAHLRKHHLEGIGGLVLLRYLGLAGTDVDELPEEIGELEQLDTLNLRRTTNLNTLPACIAEQIRLAHLLIEATVKLPSKILEMQGLEEVSTIGVGNSSSIGSVVQLLKKSERLRVLGLRFDRSHLSDDENARALFEQVANCTKLRSLSLDCLDNKLLDLLLRFPPSDELRRFELKVSAPLRRGLAPLVSVTHMDIEIVRLNNEGVRVLGGLPKLVLLKLVSSGIIESKLKLKRIIEPQLLKKIVRVTMRLGKRIPLTKKKGINSRCTVSGDDGFNCLKVFSFNCLSGGTELRFTSGAMKKLERLSLQFSALQTKPRYGNFSFGIPCLSSLTHVHATVNCKSAKAKVVRDAEKAIRDQVAMLSSVQTAVFSTNNTSSGTKQTRQLLP